MNSIVKRISNISLHLTTNKKHQSYFLKTNKEIKKQLQKMYIENDISYQEYKNQIDYLFDLNECIIMYINEHKAFLKDKEEIIKNSQELKNILNLMIHKK